MRRRQVEIAQFKRTGLCSKCVNFNTVQCPITYIPIYETSFVTDYKGIIYGAINVTICPYYKRGVPKEGYPIRI